MKKIGDVTVNDGKGLYDNEGLCDTLKTDCNNMLKALINGQYIVFTAFITGMVQKIDNLKKGIAADLQSKDKIIEELKAINDSLMEEKTGLPVDKGGAENGDDRDVV